MVSTRYRGGRGGKHELEVLPEEDSLSQDMDNISEKKSPLSEKDKIITAEAESKQSSDVEGGVENYNTPAETANDLITEVIHVRDDPSLNPWTFRVWFLGTYSFHIFEIIVCTDFRKGIGLSTFGGCLATIYYFKPQTALVSQVFLAVVSYVIGEAMARIIPNKGWIGRLFNPHPVRHV
jgi:hypothetical protein